MMDIMTLMRKFVKTVKMDTNLIRGNMNVSKFKPSLQLLSVQNQHPSTMEQNVLPATCLNTGIMIPRNVKPAHKVSTMTSMTKPVSDAKTVKDLICLYMPV